jgi:hypothetical protein
MVLDVVEKQIEVFQQRQDLTAVAATRMERQFMKRLVLGLATIGVVAIAPLAFSQNPAQAMPENAAQRSTCISDPQSLTCSPASPSSKAVVTSPAASTATNPSAPAPLLSAEQQKRLSDMLFGLLYFVLPAGFGLGLFLHDRYQNHRAATLEAQIKLLEKLWEQSPQG